MNMESVIALRMQRQCLSKPAQTHEEYEALFRRMQPVPPVFFSCPGDPPTLVHRAAFDDRLHNDNLRASRAIVKGRFQGGTVGYVYADELELYVGAYRKDIDRLTARQQRIFDLLLSTGPLTCAQIKQETGLLVKEIMPDLHKLQEAFLVYEDQPDGDWERGWYVFEREWDGVDIHRYSRVGAIKEILRRFLYLNVFAALASMKSWFRLPGKDISAALMELVQAGEVVMAVVGGEQGWMLPADCELVESGNVPAIKPSVFVLHRSDFLVKSQEYLLKERFPSTDVLQYILIDGQFQGVVLGHWRQGPHDVEDVIVALPDQEKTDRKREILDAVAQVYDRTLIQSYCGDTVSG